ncbi:acyltransferase [Thiorhodococcus mannitoliphagus]|uniref:Acyltransferase n=1 Tax=Thiorhodococcus mannitoliphagus TaxID=329406 RepID=A0A6P1DTC4_9GAMM|nr:acyltransferase [Thiorhodococcus mannitoliphagus]NEX21368.1 acyltransferase [Thiorhodococcus mannitoliphagus]
MATALYRCAVSRDNNFNLIRFLAAALVLFSHSFPLAGKGDDEPLYALVGMSWGSLAVDVFFVTSGFLIARSFFERKSLLAFAWARLLRIYPALIVAVLFSALIVGGIFTTHGLAAYLRDPQTREYILTNSYLLSGIKFGLPGVFADNPYKDGVNGSLWTLPYEVKLYIRLALGGLLLLYLQRYFGRHFLKISFLSIALVSILLNIGNHFQGDSSEHFIRFSATFFAGTAFYLFRDHIMLSSKAFWALSLLLLLSLLQKDLFFVVYSLGLPYLIIYLAYAPSGVLKAFNGFGDYSYGIYIYAFPVQQSVAAMAPGIAPHALAALSFAITLPLAFASWHGVEKRCLKMKGGYQSFERRLRRLRLKVTAKLSRV